MHYFLSSSAELVCLHDEAFIQAAYESLLGRPADEAGLAYYLARLRTGYSKLSILRQLRSSEESRQYAHGIADLDKVLARYWLGQLPLVGWAFRGWWKLEGESAAERSQRIMINELFCLRQQLQEDIAQAAALASMRTVHTHDNVDQGRHRRQIVEQLSPQARQIFDRLVS